MKDKDIESQVHVSNKDFDLTINWTTSPGVDDEVRIMAALESFAEQYGKTLAEGCTPSDAVVTVSVEPNHCTAEGCGNGPEVEDDGLCDLCDETPADYITNIAGDILHVCEDCDE